MNEVTRIISSINSGEKEASEKLLPLVYSELRRLAASHLRRKSSTDSIQATELVHEAFLRLVDVSVQQSWDSRGHFFASAAEAMRRILIERARRKSRIKHGGNWKRVVLNDTEGENGNTTEQQNALDLLALDDALKKMDQEYPDHSQLVKLRYFAGLSVEDAGRSMGISRATAARYWTFSKAWLLDAIEGSRSE